MKEDEMVGRHHQFNGHEFEQSSGDGEGQGNLAYCSQWGGLPFPTPGNLPDPGIKPRSPELQADSLPSKPQGKPME